MDHEPKHTATSLSRDLSSIEIRVALLEQTSVQLNVLFSKLDTTIEKLTDVSSSIRELVAAHETKIKQIDVLAEEIHEVESSIYKEIEKINDQIGKEIVLIKEEEKVQHMVLNNKLDSITTSFNKRLSWFERARWLIIGAAAVVGFFLSRIDSIHNFMTKIIN